MSGSSLLNTASISSACTIEKTWAVIPFLTCFIIGCMMPLGFAPFHKPGLSILGLMLFYGQLQHPHQFFIKGLAFGLGYFGIGVSWIYVSIHAYGHLSIVLSCFITILFILYLSLYTACLGWLYSQNQRNSALLDSIWFSSLWTMIEYARSYLLTGFPWLLIGVSQFDTPLKGWIPLIGIYGTTFMTCIIACWLWYGFRSTYIARIKWWLSALSLLFLPQLWVNHTWIQTISTPFKIGIIQANLSMRDKWDKQLFWSIMNHYYQGIQTLLKKDLIILPESAFPIPQPYIYDFLSYLNEQAIKNKTAILFGIPLLKQGKYYNGLASIGAAHGKYIKQYLVPFGEYIPSLFLSLAKFLNIDDPALTAGPPDQALIQIKHHAIASLICYELGYASLLRKQLPQAEWIVSISDNGWFGRSLAIYQQLQIAQVLSLQTGRYQIVSNNDGLSAILDTQGHIIKSLPAFSSGILTGQIYPATGKTPWVIWGNIPVMLLLTLLSIGIWIRKFW